MTVQTVDSLFMAGLVRDFELLVRTPTQTRAVWVVHPRALESDQMQTVAVVKVGDTIELNGEPATPAQLAAIHADQITVVPEMTVTMQRIADVIAMTGGRATLGGLNLPTVVPPPK